MTSRTWRYGLTANVVVLGIVSLFTDFSSEMILPILPFFLTQVLSANALIVGLIEGAGDAVVAFMKVLSGRWSDVAGSRKGFVEAGYGLSTVMKILFPFASVWPAFFGMRVVERLGKGVRDAPRDALLSESTPPETRGKAFGFHRSMDTAGGGVGPVVTLVLLATLLPAWGEAGAYRLIILVAALPAALSFTCVSLVREPRRVAAPQPRLRVTLGGVPGALKLFILTASVFSFADFSVAFLLLRVTDVGETAVVAILLYVLFNVVYAAHAFPAGILSDRGGRAEGTQRALVADLAPPESRATVLGAYHASVGIVKLASGLVAGLLWVAVAPAATFWFGAVFACAAAGMLLAWRAPVRS